MLSYIPPISLSYFLKSQNLIALSVPEEHKIKGVEGSYCKDNKLDSCVFFIFIEILFEFISHKKISLFSPIAILFSLENDISFYIFKGFVEFSYNLILFNV